MSRAFSEHEIETIRAQMREKGQRLFERQGIQKTSVAELAQAVGISKGAFYRFYGSKEELFMEILEVLEADFRARIFDISIQPRRNARQQLAKLFRATLLTWDRYPLLKNFGMADYEYLARKLPPERVQAHAHHDDEFVKEFIKRIRREGISVKVSPRLISNLMKSLFFVSLHREDLGKEAYVETMETLADLVARFVTEGA